MAERTLRVLELFSVERPLWTAEEIAAAMGVAASSAYRVLGEMVDAGVVEAAAPGRYALGSAIIKLDRQIQMTDPLLHTARPMMGELLGFAPDGSSMVLCGAFRRTVLCIHQAMSDPQAPVTCERGRSLPLFRGAPSKSILAHTPPRVLKQLYAEHSEEIAAAALGSDWAQFSANLRILRKAGCVVTHAEVDMGRCAISAAILKADGRAMGSLTYVIDDARADARQINRLVQLVIAAARDIEHSMARSSSRTLDAAVMR